jgi:hypothetical protein
MFFAWRKYGRKCLTSLQDRGCVLLLRLDIVLGGWKVAYRILLDHMESLLLALQIIWSSLKPLLKRLDMKCVVSRSVPDLLY